MDCSSDTERYCVCLVSPEYDMAPKTVLYLSTDPSSLKSICRLVLVLVECVRSSVVVSKFVRGKQLA